MRHIIQRELNDCGIACALMILQHDLNLKLDYYNIKNNIQVEENGVRLDNLIEFLGKYGEYKAYECLFSDLPAYPFITIIKVKKKYNHYIVVWKKDSKYIYYSNPAENIPKKISLKKFKKIYLKVIIYCKKEEIPTINFNKRIIINNKKYLLPLIFLNAIDFILFGLSFLYLINEKELDVLKILFFFSIITIQISIYLLKNYFVNKINKDFDNSYIDGMIREEDIKSSKEYIKKSYFIKNKKNILYNKILPNVIIFVFSICLIFYLHYLLAFALFIHIFIFYIIELFIFKKKNYYTAECQSLEEKFNNSNTDLQLILQRINFSMKKISKVNIAEAIINVFYRQIIIVSIALIFILIKQEQFIFIGIYLSFYLVDCALSLAQYNSDKAKYKYIVFDFCQEIEENNKNYDKN